MLSILHQIYIMDALYLISNIYFCQLQTRFFLAKSSCIQLCIKTKPSRHILVKSDYYWPACLELLSSSHYFGYLIKKLTSITRERSQLRLTGFSISPPTVVLKGSKFHTSISGQFADRLGNLSCVCISKWEYIFWVIYILKWQ